MGMEITITEDLVMNMCFSYNHEFGFLNKEDQESIVHRCKKWLIALNGNINYAKRKAVETKAGYKKSVCLMASYSHSDKVGDIAVEVTPDKWTGSPEDYGDLMRHIKDVIREKDGLEEKDKIVLVAVSRIDNLFE